MLPLLAAVVVGSLVGFVGSRQARRRSRPRPQPTPSAPATAPSAAPAPPPPRRRKGLTTPELQRACFAEMVRHVRVDRQGRSQAPARYLLRLHPDDLDQVDEARDWFTEGLADALREAATEHGWSLEGDIDVRFEADPSRRAGVPTALAVAPEGAQPEPAGRRSLALRRLDTGERFPLGDGPVTIGRADDQTVTIADKRVSRAHAVVAPGRGGWTVTDQGSSNGTSLDGRLLSPGATTPLRPGSTIGIGPVELEVEGGGPPRPGNRALDDRDRTRISGEVLGPERRPRP